MITRPPTPPPIPSHTQGEGSVVSLSAVGERHRSHCPDQPKSTSTLMLGDRARRDGVRLRLGYIEDDFEQLHSAEFDRQYMVKLFDYGRAKARSGFPWRRAPPGF